MFTDAENSPRPAARDPHAHALQASSTARPFIHLVDGGVSDNVGMRGVLDALEVMQALHEAGMKTPLDNAKRIIVVIVNSLSVPSTDWDESESPPGPVQIMLKAAGTPIDANSFESIEQLKDTAARWRTMRLIRDSAAMAGNTDPAVAAALRVPNAEIYAIDVSFSALKDKAERAFLNQLPTSFVLPDEAVDRLRAAAGTIIADRPSSPAEGRGRARRAATRGETMTGQRTDSVGRRLNVACAPLRVRARFQLGRPVQRLWPGKLRARRLMRCRRRIGCKEVDAIGRHPRSASSTMPAWIAASIWPRTRSTASASNALPDFASQWSSSSRASLASPGHASARPCA
jgi:hypothetical protein